MPERLHGRSEEANLLNKMILEKVQLGGGAFLSGTVMNDVFWWRACILHPRTTRSDLDAMLDVVRKAAAEERTSHG